MIKTIAGWVEPSSGELRFEGVSLRGIASEQICRRGIGLVPEDRRIFPGLTVEENLRLGFLQVPGRCRAESRRMLEEIYQRFPRLAERRRQMGTTHSGGEQQMPAMARVLAGAPKLLLIDEPTEGLAPMLVDELFVLMSSLAKVGIPIVLVEQNVGRAIELTHRFYLIGRGQVVMEGRSDNASERTELMDRIRL